MKGGEEDEILNSLTYFVYIGKSLKNALLVPAYT